MQEDFVSIKPKNSLLSQLIDYYYFHNILNENSEYNVLYYPHYQTAINFYENAEVTWDNSGRIIQQIDENKTECLFTRNTKVSRYVTIKGSVNKIGIVFKPLGINHFINCDLQQISSNIISPFNYFGDSFYTLSNTLFGNKNIDNKRDLLDQFFIKRYVGFKDQEFKNLVFKIINTKPNLFVKDMASDLKINRKTLLRKFKSYLCVTPSEFKSLIKFRNALHLYNTNYKLTKIAYDSNYYDQSHFIKNYKSLVGKSPKSLFSNLSKFGKNNTLWTKVD